MPLLGRRWIRWDGVRCGSCALGHGQRWCSSSVSGGGDACGRQDTTVADGSTGAAIDRVDGERLFPSKAMRCAERGRLQHGCRLTRVEAAMARQAGELVDLQTEGKASAARLQRVVEGLEQMGDILGEVPWLEASMSDVGMEADMCGYGADALTVPGMWW